MKALIHLLIMMALIILFLPVSALAKHNSVKRDTNKDGKIDQIAHLDKDGKITKLEVDSNADGIMDKFQYYKKGEIIRVERDTNYDQKIDTWDYFEQGKNPT